jgi:hypothetical protein
MLPGRCSWELSGRELRTRIKVTASDRSEPEFPARQRETKPRMRLSLKERGMKPANAIKTDRKSGVAEGRDLRCAIRVPHIYRSAMVFDAAKTLESTMRTLPPWSSNVGAMDRM